MYFVVVVSTLNGVSVSDFIGPFEDRDVALKFSLATHNAFLVEPRKP